ncbi:28S ribosomal protein S35, mitochondrial isoform X2 [Protopterus annectens]|uniref:28S ribosomal protein S35, mitochondrial isoform X2 n=1 Tax=Protopterus annectens TaxID=7888 RepID=UPI001CFBEF3F|nr:28S ribosomal protein S35, mitochondrial isoform X2 [Protopterus annectens]
MMAASFVNMTSGVLNKSNNYLIGIGRYSLNYFIKTPAYSTALSVNAASNKPGVRSRGKRSSQNARQRRVLPAEPRTELMPTDQDWTSVYPSAAVFKPSAVPLPIRMGYPVKRGVPPEKKGNLELMKIPNFLHLTPAAIKKHCSALKDFCTEWPAALDTDEKCEQHFPIEIVTTDYVSAGPSVRSPKARIVKLSVKLSRLNMDDHARKKFIKLVGERYCKDTDTLTITTDRCPLRRQNYDYALYLLTVLYHESWVAFHQFFQSINQKQNHGKVKRQKLIWKSTFGRTVHQRKMFWRHFRE